MLVTGWKFAIFYADIDEGEPVEIRVERDEDDIQAIQQAVDEFWKHVTDDTEPELTGVDVDLAQSDIMPEGWEQTEDTELEDLLNRIDGYKAEENAAKKARTACEDRVKQLIGNDRQGFITRDWKPDTRPSTTRRRKPDRRNQPTTCADSTSSQSKNRKEQHNGSNQQSDRGTQREQRRNRLRQDDVPGESARLVRDHPAGISRQAAEHPRRDGVRRTIGLNGVQSLQNITVINGTPTASASFITGLVRHSGHKLWTEKDPQNLSVTAFVQRADDPEHVVSVTRDKAWAQQMGLLSKDNYRKQPLTMLTWRAITAAAREACPEILFGVQYTPDELYDMDVPADDDDVAVEQVEETTNDDVKEAE
mgnify:CR=1 FL=1